MEDITLLHSFFSIERFTFVVKHWVDLIPAKILSQFPFIVGRYRPLIKDFYLLY